MKEPPKKEGAFPPHAPIHELQFAERNSQSQSLQEREVQLLWLAARALVHIDSTLTDIATLAQQQTDLLRRLVRQEPRP